MACLLCLIGSAKAVDLGPYDGVAPPPGVTAGSIQVGHRSFQGDVSLNDANLGARVDRHNVNIRIGRSAEWAGTPVYGYASLPYSQFELGDELGGEPLPGVQLQAGEGLGDLALAGAIWPYVDRNAGRFVGLAGYAIVPTGDYAAEKTFGLNLNPGNNRFAGIVQAGLHQRINNRFDWSIAADAMFFEDNDRFIGARFAPGTLDPAAPARLEVKPYFSYQTALAWQANPAISVAASVYADRGGAFRVAGGDWSRATNRERYGLWARLRLSPRARVTVNYKSTINDRADLPLQDNLQIRLIRLF